MTDPAEWAKQVALTVKEYLAKEVAPLKEEIDKLKHEGRVDHLNLDNLHERVMKMEARPAPEKGEKGDRGDQGEPGLSVKGERGDPGECITGPPGEPGKSGLDGKSVTLDDVRPLFDAAMATWQLDFERRAQDVLQRSVDRMPKPKDGVDGKDGRDGVGIDDVSVERDGRIVRLSYLHQGKPVKTLEWKSDEMIHRDIFRSDGVYEKGDVVTYGGSMWLATKENPTGYPGRADSDGWRLVVKHGRDGR